MLSAGVPLKEASAAVVLLHGRGAPAEDILMLGEAMGLEYAALLAPEAAGRTWYPESFLAPREENEPWLSSALETIGLTVQYAMDAGIAPERIAIAGFSQGACLSTEFVARHPQRYAAVAAFTGGLIGATLDAVYAGELGGTPVLLSSGDPDPHVPWSRVERTGEVLRGMGAEVTLRRYPGRPHTISREEVREAAAMFEKALRGETAG